MNRWPIDPPCNQLTPDDGEWPLMLALAMFWLHGTKPGTDGYMVATWNDKSRSDEKKAPTVSGKRLI